MKLSQNMNGALNQQVLHEYRNMLIYKQIASFFENLQLKNLSKYFNEQAQQEKEHGDKFIQHINDRSGGNLVIGDIMSPPTLVSDINMIGSLFVSTEEETTESIEEIYELAFNEKSYIDLPFLSDMLQEQIEEEDIANEFLAKISSVKDMVLFDATFE